MFVTLWLKAEFRSQSKSGDMFRSARSAYVCTGSWPLRRRFWLSHADARQVCDLPEGLLRIQRSMTAGPRPKKKESG
jgi:hypothetical protein